VQRQKLTLQRHSCGTAANQNCAKSRIDFCFQRMIPKSGDRFSESAMAIAIAL
jgi:hypothetical protein